MLRLTLTLHSAIDGNAYDLGSLTIINDGTGTHERGNYDVVLVDKRDGAKTRTRRGRVEDYLRSAGAWELVAKAILGKAGR